MTAPTSPAMAAGPDDAAQGLTAEARARLNDALTWTDRTDRTLESVFIATADLQAALDALACITAELAEAREEARIANGYAVAANRRCERLQALNNLEGTLGCNCYTCKLVRQALTPSPTVVGDLVSGGARYGIDPRVTTVKAAEAGEAEPVVGSPNRTDAGLTSAEGGAGATESPSTPPATEALVEEARHLLSLKTAVDSIHTISEPPYDFNLSGRLSRVHDYAKYLTARLQQPPRGALPSEMK